MYDDMDKVFPFDEMRPLQKNLEPVLKEKLQDSKSKYIFCEFATGTGKSPLALMIARAAGSAYILTANKSLQEQYVKDFNQYMIELKGRSNYPCANHTRKDKSPFNCSDSPCQRTAEGRKFCITKKECGYHKQLDKAGRADVTLFNFASGYMQFRHNKVIEGEKGGIFDKRRILIIDEAHLVPEYLTSMSSISISRQKFKDLFSWTSDWNSIQKISSGKPEGWIDELTDCDKFEDWVTFFRDLSIQCSHMLDNMMFSNKADLDSFASSVDMFLSLVDNLSNEYGDKFSPEDLFSIEYGEKGISFQPVNIKTLFEFLCSFADKIILMSATFLNIPIYLKMLGIDSDKCSHIYAGSPFKRENRLVRVSETVGNLSTFKYPENKLKMYKAIDGIVNHYKGQKGVIHSPSYSWASDIYDNVSPATRNRILFPKNSSDKDRMIKIHCETDRPTILLSPSMREGLDLKDDLARFQIISKIQWPNMKDPLIMKRDKVYPRYSKLLTILALIQSCGRGVRNEDDNCTAFVLDNLFWYLINNNRDMIPEDFYNTIVRG